MPPEPHRTEFEDVLYIKNDRLIARRFGTDKTLIVYDPNVALGDCDLSFAIDYTRYNDALAVHGELCSQIRCDFKRYLFDKLGLTKHPKRYRLYSIAWEIAHRKVGHPDDFFEIEEAAVLLKELLESPEII